MEAIAPKRQVSLDVLRCFLMYLVVLQHTIVHGALPYSELASRPMLFLLGMTFPAVDGFTAISGWFGVKCTIRKLFRLGALIFFCGTLSFVFFNLFHSLFGEFLQERLGIETNTLPWSYEVYRYWYLGAYIKLMVLSIALNPILEWIRKRSRAIIAVSGVVLAVVIYWIKFQSGWTSQSWQTLVLVYVFMRLLISLRPAQVVWEVLFAVLFCVTIVLCHFGQGGVLHDYANPITVLAGITIVGFANGLQIPKGHWLARACVFLAPSMISVYMLHSIFVVYVVKPATAILSKLHLGALNLLAFLLLATLAFALSVCVDLIRRKVVCLMNRLRNDFEGIHGS